MLYPWWVTARGTKPDSSFTLDFPDWDSPSWDGVIPNPETLKLASEVTACAPDSAGGMDVLWTGCMGWNQKPERAYSCPSVTWFWALAALAAVGVVAGKSKQAQPRKTMRTRTTPRTTRVSRTRVTEGGVK